ncbi:MAG: YifB family Mg chelatase-like AAA ATPase [Eggerthellales bacterium]|nr:YifB family Mg chelatase-like AAA ATPase [Eggerthellales bacterium]
MTPSSRFGRCVVLSATLRGIEAVPVHVEVSIGPGLPGFSIVGMADAAIQESRERVKAAIRACGFTMPADKIVVNLAPSSLKKTGSGFDLPIALGLLVASGQVNPAIVRDSLVVGELSLEGATRPVSGILAYQLGARELGCNLICPEQDEGLYPLSDLLVFVADSLRDFAGEQGNLRIARSLAKGRTAETEDYQDVGGHEVAKRALQIAAAGLHGVLMVGPPGSGKTMLASRLPTILPPLNDREMLETAQVCSVAGEDITSVLQGRRPFRAPHHSVTTAGLIGGGSPPRPGEVSLAHHGVLFLDEFAEFKPSTLQAMRQPLEKGEVTIVRADGSVTYPSRFMLLAAMNPCPCGYYGDPSIECTCSATQIANYQSRIGGPLLDRIDIQINVWRTEFQHIAHGGGGTTSEQLLQGVMRGRAYASYRKEQQTEDSGQKQDLIRAYQVDASAERLLETFAKQRDLSGRAIVRTVRVARTIADMDESPLVKEDHVSEALTLRLRERGL